MCSELSGRLPGSVRGDILSERIGKRRKAGYGTRKAAVANPG